MRPIVDCYSRRAREYERIDEKPERRHDLEVLRRLVAHRLAGREVLEIACGTGYWTEVFAPAARVPVAAAGIGAAIAAKAPVDSRFGLP